MMEVGKMKHQRAGRCLRIAAAASIAVAGSVRALAPEQFAVGWPLELPADRGIFDVPLTREVYEHAESVDEISILDANGEPLPFYRVGAVPVVETETRVRLDASPFYAAPPDGAGADLDIVSGRDGTRVRVARPPGDAQVEMSGFLIDARDVEFPPVAVELDWRALEQPFLMEVSIEHSPTLTGWGRVGGGAIAALLVDGSESRHARVPLAAAAGGYYRVAASRSVPDWQLIGVTLIGAEREGGSAPQTALLRPSDLRPDPSDAGALYFDAGGPLPVTRVALDFGTGNGWARASIASSDTLDGPWRVRAAARLFYAVAFEGRRFVGDPAAVGRVEDRYWKVTFAGDPPARPVDLELEYLQEYLRFAADGAAPFLLAAGTVTEEAGPDTTFEAVWNALAAAERSTQRAELGVLRELGGAAALVAPAAFPWRSALLWAVLGLGVLVVAAMAVRLARDMLRDSQSP